jgi:hypothetical protein
MQEQATTAMGALRSLASTQTQVDVFSDQIIDAVKNGEADPLEVAVQLKAMEKASERIWSEIKESAITAAERHGKTFQLYGNTLKIQEVGTKYDYEATGDPVWARLDAIASIAIENRKNRETFLRSINGIVRIVDESTGEEVELKPAPKTSQTTVTVSIK